MSNDKLLMSITNLEHELLELRRNIHQNPEVGFDIPNTKKLVRSTLESYGYNVLEVGRSGLSVSVGSGSGPCILLRADMDALPILEDTNLPFSSKNHGKMHACGHDIHTTMLLGAAKIFKEYESKIEGTIKLMFQPAEETLEGAKDMIENGILLNPKPDVASMIHVASGMPISVGSVVLFDNGPIMAASDTLRISIKGLGGHGSSPYLTKDPMIPVTTLINALQSIQSREMVPDALMSLTFGLIDGAYTSNVISDEIVIGGTLRTYSTKQREYIKSRIESMTHHIAKAFQCEGLVSYPSSSPVFENNGELSNATYESLKDVFNKDKLVGAMKLETPIMGSEDFAYISQEIPSILIYLGAGDSRNGEVYGVHSPKVVFNEACILEGVKAHVFTALGWLNKNKGV